MAMEMKGRPRCSETLPPMSASSTRRASTFAARHRGGAVAQDRAGSILDALHGELEGVQAFELTEMLVEFAQGSGGIVLLANQLELDASGADTSFSVCNAEDDDVMTAAPEGTRQGGHGVDVAGAGEAKRSKPRQAGTSAVGLGPE